MPQIVPSKVLDARLLEIPFPFRTLDTLSEAPSLAGKNERIMEHPGEALQGSNHHIIHGDMPVLSCFGLANRDPLPLEVEVFPHQVKHFSSSHPRMKGQKN